MKQSLLGSRTNYHTEENISGMMEWSIFSSQTFLVELGGNEEK